MSVRITPAPVVPAVVSAALATVLVGALVPGGPAAGAPAPGAPAPAAAPAAAPGDRDARQRAAADPGTVLRTPGQTSDGVPGLVVGDRVSMRGQARVANELTYEIAPGVTVREWDQVDGRQPVGQVRVNLVTVSLDAPDLSFEYLSSRYVPARKKVSHLATKAGALVAVNGDFFDISDTGAPLGIGIDRARGLVAGSREGWIPENMSLWFDGAGPHLGPLSSRPKLKQHPRWKVSGLNSPKVPRDGLGLYDTDWGWTKGYSVTDGDQKVREVVVVDGRVRSNRWGLTKGKKIKGHVLVARGKWRSVVKKKMRVGSRAVFTDRVRGGNPQVAITGDRPILVNGVRTVVNDRLAHPRTAVGIDADGRTLLFLTIDGRSSVSRGYTMVELADMMTALGAENALNLDGGGSSTMWSRRVTGEMGLINEPSDGQERRVPNGLGVVFHGTLPPVVQTYPTPTPTPTAAPTTPPTEPTTPPAP